jgi:hypothetical protein
LTHRVRLGLQDDGLGKIQEFARKSVAIIGRCSKDTAEAGKDFHSSLGASCDHAGETLLSASPRRLSVSAKDLAIDDRWTACLIRRPTGSLQPRVLEEGEDLIVMLGHMVPEPEIGFVGQAPVQKTLEPCFQPANGDQQSMRGEFTLVSAIPESESAVEEFEQSSGKTDRSSGRALQKTLAPSDQMLQALLMQGLQEPVVGKHGSIGYALRGEAGRV